uniref:RxLR effector candidate protein n=1 Tax=Hyaloperonospora arabidopsidis (strain Emoy2) TaxID=559515 RepID=M4C1W6_HYAAE
MRLAYAAVATLAALFACSLAVSTSADPKDVVKPVLSKVSQSAIVRRATDVAVAAATRAKAQANSIAVRSTTNVGNPLGAITPLWNMLSYGPISNGMMTMLTKFAGQATGVIRAGALTVKSPLEKLESKYMASIGGLLKITPLWNKLATNPTAVAIKTQLEEKITDVIQRFLIWVVKVQFQSTPQTTKRPLTRF